MKNESFQRLVKGDTQTHPDTSLIFILVHFSSGVHELIYHCVSGSISGTVAKYISANLLLRLLILCPIQVVKLFHLSQRLLKTKF